MTVSDDRLLDLPLRTLIARAGKGIVKNSTQWPRFERRIDLNYDVVFYDSKLQRDHKIRVRVRFTAESLIFHSTEN